MLTTVPSIEAKSRTPYRTALLSATVHGIALLFIFGVLHSSPKLAPFRLPGTAQGVKMITYYAPGSPEHTVSDIPTKDAPPQTSAASTHAPLAAPKPKTAAAPAAETGTGVSADSGLGEGDIKIALQTYNPYPKPSLSDLARGTKGDVILDAVIDEHGKITGLTLLHGLGPSIDNEVIATVKQWSYSPATRNGVPIPSEQELHFHYERS